MSAWVKIKTAKKRSGLPGLRAIAEAVVPEIGSATTAEWQAMQAIIQRAIAQRPARVQRQLRLFLTILNILALIRHGRVLRRLDAPVRTRFLEGIERSPMLLLRRGFWGIRTLILMGYYARPEGRAAVGYGATARGWSARR